jgi:ketosteroid isomerase-like protein
LAGVAGAADMKLPELKQQATAQAVLDEHVDALNHCDFQRIMAQYPDDAEFILPNGVWFKGRTDIAKLFSGFCKDHKDGGFKGATFIAEESNTIGDTINVSWRMEADWLKEPYKGADAYVTKNGYMQGQVTTFDPADMKMK